MYASFIGAILSITSIWWSMSKTEIPPTAEEIEYIKNPLNIFPLCRYL
jgi:maltose/moltooligosaccharide transporter